MFQLNELLRIEIEVIRTTMNYGDNSLLFKTRSHEFDYRSISQGSLGRLLGAGGRGQRHATQQWDGHKPNNGRQ